MPLLIIGAVCGNAAGIRQQFSAFVGIQMSLLSARQNRRAREMTVNYFGTLSGSRAFTPIIAMHCGGAPVNVLSVAIA
ncbi:hypothetical protein ABH944_009085 [Caballeronia udeis]|uniref:Uncharacterized protein n=1 Tax=Caballeronia udeis TaxID=1232866 RepID=A0ABW8MZ47_9BURK